MIWQRQLEDQHLRRILFRERILALYLMSQLRFLNLLLIRGMPVQQLLLFHYHRKPMGELLLKIMALA